MPIYEYKCDIDNEKKEELLTWSEVDDIKAGKKQILCDKCGNPMTKQISLGSFQLKGTGFHATDYPKLPTNVKISDKG